MFKRSMTGAILTGCLSVYLFMAGTVCGAVGSTGQGEQRVLSKKLFIDKTENLSMSGGLLKIPRQYKQAERGEVIIEGEEPTRFVPEDANNSLKTFGKDEKNGDLRYIAHLQRAFYDIEIVKPVKLRLWYHAYFPTVGTWCHTEILDQNSEKQIIDNNTSNPNDPSVNRWVWKKGELYDFSAGRHVFSLDWQAGDKLDQLAFLPEGMEPKEDKVFPPTYGTIANQGTAVTVPVVLRGNQKLQTLRTQGDPAGGRIEIYLSEDVGKNWKIIPENGDLGGFSFSGEKKLLFKFVLSASSQNLSPVVLPDSLTVFSDSSQMDAAIQKSLPPEMLHKERSLELLPASWKGIRPDEQGWKMANASMPDEKGIIWLDAADANQLLFSAKQQSWIQEDKDAFSGKAVYQGSCNRNLISFDVALPNEVKCRPWFRIRLFRPVAEVRDVVGLGILGHYYPSVSYQFDRSEVVNCEFTYDKESFPLAAFQKQEWVWAPGKAVSLKQGYHVFRIRKGLDYTLIDRVALVCGEGPSPEGKGGVSKKEMATEGEVVFHSLNTASLADITQFKTDAKETGSVLSYEYSLDQGTTFTPFSKESASKAMQDQKEITLKAVIRAANKDDKLSIGRFTAELAGEGKADIALANMEQKILFDVKTGMLSGWWTKQTGWILAPGYAQPCFGFLIGNDENGFKPILQNNAELTEVIPGIKNQVKTLQLTYELVEGTVVARVCIELPAEGLARWHLNIENKSNNDVRNIRFPLISGIRLGNDPEQVCSIPLRYLQTGDDDTPGAPLSMMEKRPSESWVGHHEYPGNYSLGMVSFYNQTGGFTAQVRDKDGIGTFIGLEPDPASVAMNVIFHRLLTIEGGQRSECQYDIGFHEGDWHRAADLYSQWAHSWMDFSTYVNANWAKYADAQVAGWHYITAYMANRCLTHLVPETEWVGFNSWMHYFTGIGWTVYGIDPRFGTIEEIRKANEEAAKHGIHRLYYTELMGYVDLWAISDIVGNIPRAQLPPEYKIPPAGFGIKWGTKDAAGLVSPSGWIQPTPATVICTPNKAVKDYCVEGIAKNYSSLLGAHGVYSDESHAFSECYDITHDHGKQYGLYSRGTQAIFKEALDTARKKNPDFVIICEGFPDQLLQYADFGVNGSDRFLYAIPEAKMLMSPQRIGSLEEAMRTVHLYSRGYFMGTELAANNRNFYAHRKRIKDWMYEGRFRDDVGLAVSRPGIVAKWFERDDKEHQGALINIQNEFMLEGATVSLQSPRVKDASFALAYLFDEEEVIKVACEKEGNGIKVSVPKAKASSILVPVKCPEKESIRAHGVWPQAAGSNRLVLFVANLSKQARTVSLGYTLPEGVTLKDAPASVQVEPLDLKRIEMPMNGLASLAKHGEARISVKERRYATNCVVILAPPLYNGGFETDSAGKGTPDGWRTFGHMWYTHLMQHSELPFDVSHADGVLDPKDPAEGKYSLRLDGSVPLRDYWGKERYMWTKELKEEREKAPVKPWCFNTGHPLILKPGTTYKVSFKFKTASDDGFIEVNCIPYYYNAIIDSQFMIFKPLKVSAPKGERTWQSHEFQFVMPKDRSETLLCFVNTSKDPVWIDEVKVTEVSPGL